MRLLGWVGASAVVHFAIVVVVMAGVVPVDALSATVRPDPVTFELEVTREDPTAPVEPPPEPEPPEPESEPEPVEPEPVEPEPVAAIAPSRLPPELPRREATEEPPGQPNGSAAASGAPNLPASTMELPQVTPDARALSEDERRRRAALVNPAAVARSGFDFGPGPSQRGAPAGLGTPDRGPSERDIEAGLASGLREEAMTKRHLARAPFRLQRRSDGSHVWAGPRLTGIVNADGTVTFQDQPNVQTNGFSASGSFDLTDAIMGSAGQDPLRAEREYFMRQTEELRARLEAEHRRQEMSAGLARLPGRLTRIWQTESRTPEARRARIFALWDEITEDDPGGVEARAAVLRWIRLNLPAGSEHAYTSDELRRFNARRDSRSEFAPY